MRVHTSVANHPKTAEVWADPLRRGVLVELWRTARAAGAGFTENTVTLTHSDLIRITGSASLQGAASRLRATCEPLGYPLVNTGRTYAVTIRNFARKQGLHSADRGGLRTLEQEQEQEREQEEKSGAPKGRPPRSVPPAFAMEIAELLRDWILKADPETRVPSDLSAWAREADRMFRLDGRDFEQVKVAIEWLFTTNARSETPFVVLSMKALRAKYDRMRGVAKREREGKKDGGIREAVRAVTRRRGLDGSGTGEADPAIRGDAGGLPGGEEPGS